MGNKLGYSRMVFVGTDSLGYRYGKEYALEFFDASPIDKLLKGYSFWIIDCNGQGKPCPYSSVVTFLMNWESTHSHL